MRLRLLPILLLAPATPAPLLLGRWAPSGQSRSVFAGLRHALSVSAVSGGKPEYSLDIPDTLLYTARLTRPPPEPRLRTSSPPHQSRETSIS
eukprot:scaffold50993_cov61-Phaeocystis_antarctica.AAC.4